MITFLSVFATVMSVLAFSFASMVNYHLNQYEKNIVEWSQSVANDCNRNLSMYSLKLCDDVVNKINEVLAERDAKSLDDVNSYIEENDIILGNDKNDAIIM